MSEPDSGSARLALRTFFEGEFRSVVRNSGWSIAGTVVTVGAYFVETTILARHFGPHRFGVYLLVIAYPEAVQFFLDFRTREAMTRYLGAFLVEEEPARAAAVVKLLWLIDLAVVSTAYAIVFVSAPLIGERLTGDASAPHLMRIYGLALFAGGLDATAGSIMRVLDRFDLSFVLGGASMLLRLTLVVVAVTFGTGIHGIVWIRVASEGAATTLALCAAFILLHRLLRGVWGARFRELSGRGREIFAFLFHVNVQGSVRAAAGKLDVIAVGAIAGPTSASLYKIGVQYGSTPLLFSDPLFLAIYPQFVRAHARGHLAEIRSVGKRASTLLAVVVTPAALVLAILSRPILSTIVGDGFASAWAPFVISLAGVVPAVVFFWGRPAMLSLGDAKTATGIALGSIVVQFACLLTLTRVLHATGAAVGFAAMNLVSVALTARYLRARRLL